MTHAPNGSPDAFPEADQPSAGTDGIGTSWRTPYVVVLLLLLAFVSGSFVLNAFHKMTYRFGWDDDEGAVWWESAHVTDLKTFYHPIDQYPYFVVPYPPVFHAATWTLAQATGNMLQAGRLICVLSAIGIGVLLGLLVWLDAPPGAVQFPRAVAAAVTALLCWRLDALNTYIPEMGVDLLALFFAFLGVLLFLRLRERPGGAYVAYFCFVLAVFTKQTMVAAPAACLLVDAAMGRTRALRHLLFCVLVGNVGMGLLNWASNGQAVRHLFLYNAKQPFSLMQWFLGLEQNLSSILPVAALAVLALLPLAARRQLKEPYSWALSVLGLQLAFALVLTLTYGKNGSGVHYFLEWNFLCCGLAGLLFARVLADWQNKALRRFDGVAVLLLVLLWALTGVPDAMRRVNSVFRLTEPERQRQDVLYASDAAVLQILEQTPGPVLCENMLLTMEAHKEIPIEPGIQGFLGKAGIWDESGFVGMIDRREFGVIVLRTFDRGFWTEPVAEAIDAHYVVTEQIGDASVEEGHYTVYRPRAEAH